MRTFTRHTLTQYLGHWNILRFFLVGNQEPGVLFVFEASAKIFGKVLNFYVVQRS